MSSSPPCRHLLWGAISLALAASCAGAPTQATTPPTEAQGRCLLLTTNDSEAEFDGRRVSLETPVRYRGTLDRVAGEKKRLLLERPGAVLLVSAGDILQGRYMAPTDGDRKRAVRAAWQLYERAGYDLATLGNHDFDGGPAVLRHALLGLKRWRFVVSNLDPASPTLDNRGEQLFTEVEIRTCGGLKIGFLGLLTPSTRTISKFGDTRFKDADHPVYPAARAAVARLRNLGVDLVVALTHLGMPSDVALARAVTGIDAVVGGHTHTYGRVWKEVGETVIVQGGERFKYLGKLELAARPGGGLAKARSSWQMVRVDEKMKADPEITQAIAELRGTVPAEVIIGERKVGWALRGAERPIYGARVAREMLRKSKAVGYPADAAMLNLGGLRTSRWYRPGPVTNLEVGAIHPFGNRLVQVELNGERLRQVAEQACARSHRSRGGLRVALFGLHIRCDASKPRVRYRKAAGKVVGVQTHGQRAVELRVGVERVDPKRTYRLAVNDYLARGGSGFWVLSQAKRLCFDGSTMPTKGCNVGPTIAELVADAVRAGRFDDAPAKR